MTRRSASVLVEMPAVYLVRHGEAEPEGRGGDAARALTPKGRAAIEAVGKALAAFGVKPDELWHSPFTRAVETAALLAKALSFSSTDMNAEHALTPFGSAENAAHALRAVKAPTVVCVSHMPLLPELCAELCGARVDFGTGTVAHVVVGGGGGVLAGLWSADKLARVR